MRDAARDLRPLALTTFVGSALLFVIEPMIARQLLPITGGVPGLWNMCVVFFQFALLAGYAYSHLVTSRASPVAQSWLHGALLLASLATLPIAIHGLPPLDGDPSLWVLLALVRSVAPVFILLAAGGPLMQRWLERESPSGATHTLIAASNVGSLGALLAYPLLIEPLLALHTQSRVFAVVYVVYAALMARGLIARRVPVQLPERVV